MIKNLRAALNVFAGVCIITAMLSGCSQAGTSRAPGMNTGRRLTDTQQGLTGNNLMNTTPQYGNLAGTTQGYMSGTVPGDMAGTTQGNLAGTTPGGANLTTADRQKADNIRMQLRRMSGISDANVIVMGNTALVGFKPSGATGNMNVVKRNITNKVKEIDRTITNVSVSESSDIMTRMNRLGTNMTNNGMVTNFADEFRKLVDGLSTTQR